MSDTKSFELKPESKAIYDQLNITIDHKTGALVDNSAEVYVAALPATVTTEGIKDLHKHNQAFLPAVGLKLGEEGIKAFKKNPELERIELEVEDPAKNKFSFVFDRSKMVGAPGAAEKTERFGILNASYEMRAARKTGQYGQVRTTLSELATQALAKKK